MQVSGCRFIAGGKLSTPVSFRHLGVPGGVRGRVVHTTDRPSRWFHVRREGRRTSHCLRDRTRFRRQHGGRDDPLSGLHSRGNASRWHFADRWRCSARSLRVPRRRSRVFGCHQRASGCAAGTRGRRNRSCTCRLDSRGPVSREPRADVHTPGRASVRLRQSLRRFPHRARVWRRRADRQLSWGRLSRVIRRNSNASSGIASWPSAVRA